ncbi:MAG: hypothetical protein IKU64_01650 [Bacteroides sp.]|nr:hypothetical protein [Bacteroides sp.]
MKKDFDFDAIGKRMPFRTPEGFFERMQAETLKRAEEERRKRKMFRIRMGVSVFLSVAAMICGIVFFLKPSMEVPSQGSVSNGWMAQMIDDTDIMDLYIRELTDEELENWIEFSENDIFYELTTENLNEDED